MLFYFDRHALRASWCLDWGWPSWLVDMKLHRTDAVVKCMKCTGCLIWQFMRHFLRFVVHLILIKNLGHRARYVNVVSVEVLNIRHIMRRYFSLKRSLTCGVVTLVITQMSLTVISVSCVKLLLALQPNFNGCRLLKDLIVTEYVFFHIWNSLVI